MQLFAGELTKQNREYYKVNDNSSYCGIDGGYNSTNSADCGNTG